jgi:hypothetical protein
VPSVSIAVVYGETHAVNADPSMLHWNVVPPAGVPTNVNVGVPLFVGLDGPEVMVVSTGGWSQCSW